LASTAAIYPISRAIDEKHPQIPINPYGRSEWTIEELLQDYELAYRFRSVCISYFNAAGAQPDASLDERQATSDKRQATETHLIPLAIKAALGQGGALKVFGSDYSTPDVTCVKIYAGV
jgi:UDP-glucose 4-epimerase